MDVGFSRVILGIFFWLRSSLLAADAEVQSCKLASQTSVNVACDPAK